MSAVKWVGVSPIPGGESIRDLKEYARSGKYGDFVSDNIAWLIRCCATYRDYFQSPLPMLGIREDLGVSGRDILFDLYSSAYFKGVGDYRDLSKLNVCPYCGLRNSVGLDHYLPRRTADFPHLSFLSTNLVPSCDACQSKKGIFFPKGWPVKVKWVKRRHGNSRVMRLYKNPIRTSGGGARIRTTSRFIHPYLDGKIDVRKIGVGFEFDNVIGPYNFKVVYIGGKGSPQAKLVKFHFSKLEMPSRLLDPLRKVWDSLVPYLFDPADPARNEADVKRRISALARQKREQSGLLSMEALFLESVASSSDCISLLLKNYVPPPRNKRK
ncbi:MULTISPECIES: hypothetical protein [Burkholderia]|uniref:HNH endonuclease n=1 Tax=Burkholderia aenigmatica TaxID=2015348 RepID=A0ABY6XUD0_9BURK|nr:MULTISPECIES: hypothetical protein [Burkholderia]VWC83521.1 hypothetical protein BLA17378_04082 [Burkholderia aenigmatica]VWD20441.1 hypothetical protein BLA18628_03857 [Burkholderia aenigmatica]